MAWHRDTDIGRIRKAADCAPSIFNQHPWEVLPAADDRDTLELYAVADKDLAPLFREVAISCGAALYNIRTAIRAAGHIPSVWPVPDLDRETLIKGLPAGRTKLASVEVLASRPTPPTTAVQELYEALWLRRTDRWPYDVLPVPLPLLVEMENAAARERGWLRVLHPREQKLLLRAVAHANDQLPPGKLGGSGLNKVPPDTFGPQSELIRPDFWLPDRTARFERHPQLMALSTDDDRPLDWLRAGQALQHALLSGTRFSMSAAAGRSDRYRVSLEYHLSDWHPFKSLPTTPDGYGVTASFLTQSLELDDLRHRARRWPWQWFYSEVPQVVLRVGFAPMERVLAPPPRPADGNDPGAVWVGPSEELSA